MAHLCMQYYSGRRKEPLIDVIWIYISHAFYLSRLEKQPRPKRLDTVWFHVHDILEKENQRWTADQWLPEDGDRA